MSIDHSIMRRMSTVRDLVGAEILVIDQDSAVQDGMVTLLSEANLNVTCVSTPEAGIELFERRFFSVVIADLDTPSPGAGLATISAVKQASPTSMVVILTPRKSFDETVEAIRAGAIDIVLKAPESVPYLKERVMEAASRSVDTRAVTAILTDANAVYEQFLKLFMDSERRALDAEDRLAGRDPTALVHLDELRVLIVDSDPGLADALASATNRGYRFDKALSGGQALDLGASGAYHYAMISSNVHDLPSSMVVRSIRQQSGDTVILSYQGPGPNGKVALIESETERTIIDEFTQAEQIVERLDELAEAFRAKSRERRYTQAFRERHYDFLRRFVHLKKKIEDALEGTE